MRGRRMQDGKTARVQGGWRDFGPAAILLAGTVLAMLAALFYPSGNGRQYAVLAPPWYTMGQTVTLVRSVDDEIIDVGSLANIIIVHSERPTAVADLYRAGAWLVADPMLLRGCLGLPGPPFAQEDPAR